MSLLTLPLMSRYAGNEPIISVAPPLPGQPRNFLSSDPFQNVLDVSMPGAADDDIQDDPESKFGLYGSPEFIQSGFGQPKATTAQDEKIGRRGHAEWNFDELSQDGVDIGACEFPDGSHPAHQQSSVGHWLERMKTKDRDSKRL